MTLRSLIYCILLLILLLWQLLELGAAFWAFGIDLGPLLDAFPVEEMFASSVNGVAALLLPH